LQKLLEMQVQMQEPPGTKLVVLIEQAARLQTLAALGLECLGQTLVLPAD
jgi:hypothetical protein